MKYRVQICKCGSVHFIPWKDIEEAIEENKEFVMICSHCGAAHKFGADKSGEDKYLYSVPLNIGEITKEIFNKKFTKILYSEGKRVLMRTGQFADFYDGSTFYDCQPYFWSYKIYECKTIEEARKYYEERNDLAKQVNIKHFMDSLDEDQKEAINSYYIKAFRRDMKE